MSSFVPHNQRYSKLQDGSFQFTLDEKVVGTALPKVAIGFSITGVSLDKAKAYFYRHGDLDYLLQWYAYIIKHHNDMGKPDFSDDLMVIESANWDVEELNGIIHRERCIVQFLRRTCGQNLSRS